jgi:hypothetical protein
MVSMRRSSIRHGRRVFLVASAAAMLIMGVLTVQGSASDATAAGGPAVVAAGAHNITPVTSPPLIVAVPHKLASGWKGPWRGR